MNDVNYNFDLAFPLKISRYEYPATTKQVEATKDILFHYDEALQCFINKYNESGRKILIVTDEFITAKTYNFKGKLEETDLDRGCIFSGKEGAGLQNIIGYAVGKINQNIKLKEIALFNWQFGDFTFPLNKKSNENIKKLNTANEQFYDRLMNFIGEYRPDAVFVAGVLMWEYINSRMQNDNQTNQRMLMGRIFRGRVPIKTTGWRLKLNARKQQTNYHRFQLMGSVDCKRLCAWDSAATKHPNLIGYFSSCLRQLINGKNDYRIQMPRDVQFKLINTREKFDRLMRRVWKQKIVSVDTETAGLGHVKNTIYTIQFCYDGVIGYTIPIDHPYTPFDAKERQYIKNELQKYFEYGRSLYHIYQNGKFDLQVLFACCGVRFYNHRIYDIQSGEYALDENIKLLGLWHVKGDKKRACQPYSLDFIAERYGCSIYRNIAFSKGSRGAIGREPLTKRFVQYCGYDVIVPFQIHLLQIQEAKKRKQRKFLKFVCEQLSDTICTTAQIEHTGSLLDKRALFELKSRDGAIVQETNDILNKFKKSEACQKVNHYLMKKEGVPQGGGIFGKQTWLFDINKTDHKELLFFKALQLKPLSFMKDVGTRKGYGAVNKKFKKTYKDVAEVGIFNEYEALKHFTKGFINPIFYKMTTSEDSLYDGRLRADYEFIRVSTGRLSSLRPNLQNIPARGKLAKAIKRMFIAKKGSLLVEMDYSAHEVKDLANESGDEVLLNSFYAGLEFRSKLRILAYKYSKNIEEWLDIVAKVGWNDEDKVTGAPKHTYSNKLEIVKNIKNKLTKQIALIVLDIEAKGDIHKLNAVRFFSLENALAVDKDQRYEIKAVVFGVIYGKGAQGLAKPKAEGGLGKDEEYCQGIIDKFYLEFKGAADYLHGIHKFGRENLFVESPLGMIRHLPAYLHSRPAMQNAMDRRGPNSIIQGVASCMGISAARNLQKLIWHCFVKQGANMEWKTLVNDVHDSLKSEVAIHLVPLYYYLLEHASTTLVHRRYRDVFDYKLSIGLEMEFGMGASQDRIDKWDFTHKSLFDKMKSELEFQNKELGYQINIEREIKRAKHNWQIVRDLRLIELEESVKSKEPTYSMMLNEKNSMKMGLIL